MKSKMVLCDRAVGQVPRQGVVLGEGFAIGVKTGGGRKIDEPEQGGCREDCLRGVVGFYEMRTTHAHMAAPVSTGSPWHRKHVLVPKSHRM